MNPNARKWTQRSGRAAMCDRKVAYRTRQEAELAIATVGSRNGSTGHRSYRCPHCKWIHITSKRTIT